MNEDLHTKFAEDIGYIKGTVTAIKDHVEKQNGDIAELQKKVGKHDVIFGKIGVGVASVIFIVNAAFVIAIDWVKDLLK